MNFPQQHKQTPFEGISWQRIGMWEKQITETLKLVGKDCVSCGGVGQDDFYSHDPSGAHVCTLCRGFGYVCAHCCEAQDKCECGEE